MQNLEWESPPTSTFAGYTTHSPLRLQTKYYTAEVPIWVDEVPFSSSPSPTIRPAGAPPSCTNTQRGVSSPEREQKIETQPISTEPQLTPSFWKDEFLGPEAREVREVIGAVVVCLQTTGGPTFSLPDDGLPSSHTVAKKRLEDAVQGLKELLRAVGEVKGQIEEERGGMGEVPGLVVLVGKEEKKQKDGGAGNREGTDHDESNLVRQSAEFGAEWWDEELAEMGVFGFEVVAWDPKAEEVKGRRNEFGGQFIFNFYFLTFDFPPPF